MDFTTFRLAAIICLLLASSAQSATYVGYFSASWCGPCQTFKREVLTKKEVKKGLDKYQGFDIIDVDKQKILSARYKIKQMPTVIISQVIKKKETVLGRWSPTSNSSKANQASFLKFLKKYEPKTLDKNKKTGTIRGKDNPFRVFWRIRQ